MSGGGEIWVTDQTLYNRDYCQNAELHGSFNVDKKTNGVEERLFFSFAKWLPYVLQPPNIKQWQQR